MAHVRFSNPLVRVDPISRKTVDDSIGIEVVVASMDSQVAAWPLRRLLWPAKESSGGPPSKKVQVPDRRFDGVLPLGAAPGAASNNFATSWRLVLGQSDSIDKSSTLVEKSAPWSLSTSCRCDRVTSIEFSPNNCHMAVGCWDGHVFLFHRDGQMAIVWKNVPLKVEQAVDQLGAHPEKERHESSEKVNNSGSGGGASVGADTTKTPSITSGTEDGGPSSDEVVKEKGFSLGGDSPTLISWDPVDAGRFAVLTPQSNSINVFDRRGLQTYSTRLSSLVEKETRTADIPKSSGATANLANFTAFGVTSVILSISSGVEAEHPIPESLLVIALSQSIFLFLSWSQLSSSCMETASFERIDGVHKFPEDLSREDAETCSELLEDSTIDESFLNCSEHVVLSNEHGIISVLTQKRCLELRAESTDFEDEASTALSTLRLSIKKSGFNSSRSDEYKRQDIEYLQLEFLPADLHVSDPLARFILSENYCVVLSMGAVFVHRRHREQNWRSFLCPVPTSSCKKPTSDQKFSAAPRCEVALLEERFLVALSLRMWDLSGKEEDDDDNDAVIEHPIATGACSVWDLDAPRDADSPVAMVTAPLSQSIPGRQVFEFTFQQSRKQSGPLPCLLIPVGQSIDSVHFSICLPTLHCGKRANTLDRRSMSNFSSVHSGFSFWRFRIKLNNNDPPYAFGDTSFKRSPLSCERACCFVRGPHNISLSSCPFIHTETDVRNIDDGLKKQPPLTPYGLSRTGGLVLFSHREELCFSNEKRLSTIKERTSSSLPSITEFTSNTSLNFEKPSSKSGEPGNDCRLICLIPSLQLWRAFSLPKEEHISKSLQPESLILGGSTTENSHQYSAVLQATATSVNESKIESPQRGHSLISRRLFDDVSIEKDVSSETQESAHQEAGCVDPPSASAHDGEGKILPPKAFKCMESPPHVLLKDLRMRYSEIFLHKGDPASRKGESAVDFASFDRLDEAVSNLE